MVSYKRDIWSVIHGMSDQLYTGHSLHVTANHVYMGQQVSYTRDIWSVIHVTEDHVYM